MDREKAMSHLLIEAFNTLVAASRTWYGLIVIAIFNWGNWWFLKPWYRWLSFVCAAVLTLLLLLAATDNLVSGCFWAPKEVEFHQGMNICPGQTATFNVRLE